MSGGWRPHQRGRHDCAVMAGRNSVYHYQQPLPSPTVASLIPCCILLLALASGCTAAHAHSGTSTISVSDPVWEIRHVLPEVDFENNTVTDVSVNVGDLAYLPCRFPQMSTIHNQVSWIRRYDWHILTTGVFTYTSDLRFNVLHTEGSDDWTLQLKFVEVKDNGTYECQVYTGTGVLSQFVNLHVNTPKAGIVGPKDIHVHEGDTITLICVIKQSKPPFVFWYHGAKLLNYEGQRLDVFLQQDATKTHSKLTITDARFTDSGNYSCIPPHVEPAFVNVFVTEGCSDPWQVVGSDCVLVEESELLTWPEARDACKLLNGYLAEPTDFQLLIDFISKNYVFELESGKYLLGASDIEIEDVWRYATSGQLVANNIWGTDEPNNYKNQDCMCLWNSENYGPIVSDTWCDRAYNYVCQK